MRIIAVWSLFARWNHSVTESEGCSPHDWKNTTWPSGGMEIFSAERQRISRSGTFIATSEHTLNSAYNQHKVESSASPLRVTLNGRHTKMGISIRIESSPDRASMWLQAYMEPAEWSPVITFFASKATSRWLALVGRNQTESGVVAQIQTKNGREEDGLTMRVMWGDKPVASSQGIEEVGV